MIELLAIGFLIGLTGAAVPGPMLFATIEASLRRGWTAGPLIVLGHAAVEVLICGVILLGVFDAVSLVGGGALIIFGMMTIRSSRNATFDVKGGVTGSPVVAGALTSVSNPYFLVWWLTIGNSMILDGLRIGVVAAHSWQDAACFFSVLGRIMRQRYLVDSYYQYIRELIVTTKEHTHDVADALIWLGIVAATVWAFGTAIWWISSSMRVGSI